jgi:hypothetical protein
MGVYATRGMVAQLTDNALEIPMMIQVGFGSDAKWVVSGSAEHGDDEEAIYLLDQMGFDTVTGRLVIEDKDDLEISVNDVDLVVAEGFDFFLYEGVEVKVWYDGDDVISMTMEEDVMFGAVEYATVDDDDYKGELTMVIADKDYDVLEDAALNGLGAEANYAKVVINGSDEVEYVMPYDLDEEYFVVEELDDEIVVTYDDEEIDLEDFIIIKDGMTVTSDEIEENGLLFTFEYEEEDYVLVYNVSETGMVSRVYSESFRFEGSNYDVMGYLLDGGDLTILDIVDIEGFYDDEQEITVFFNTVGDVALVVGELEGVAKSEFFAILTDNPVEYSGRKGDMLGVDILDEDGNELAYDFVIEDFDILDDEDLVIGSKLGIGEMDGEGTLVKFYIEDDDVVEVEKLATIPTDGFELDDTYVMGARLLSSTILFMDDYETVTTVGDADFDETTETAEVWIEDGKVLVAVEVADAEAEDDETTTMAGRLTDILKLRSDVWEFTVEIDGVEEEFLTVEEYDLVEVEDLAELGIVENAIVEIEVGDVTGKIVDVEGLPAITPLELTLVTVNEKNTFAKTFEFDGMTYELTSDVVIYDDEYDIVSFRDIAEGTEVYVYVESNTNDYAYVSFVLEAWVGIPD